MKVVLIRDGKVYEAKRWIDMTIDERKNASPHAYNTDLWDDDCLFIKDTADKYGCEWLYVFGCEVEIIQENGGNE